MHPSILQNPAVKKYLLEERMLTPETVKRAKIEVKQVGRRKMIALPIGITMEGETKETMWKYRALPGQEGEAKYQFSKGAHPVLYGNPIPEGVSKVVVCEGEFDCLLLQQSFVERDTLKKEWWAVSSTGGAGTFNAEWVSAFPDGCEVVLCFDRDKAGDTGREKVRELFLESGKDVKLSDITFSPEKEEGYDVTTLFQEMRTRGLKGVDVFLAGVKEWKEPVDGEEGYQRPIAKVRKPRRDVGFGEWMGVIQKEFPELAIAAEVCASVVCQLLVRGVHNCFSLILVDVPSSGKTICLNFFTGIEEIVYASDDFSPAAFVSQAAHKKTKDLDKVDLLPRIRFKTLVVREFASIFSDSDDDLRKKLGLLTRVLDGEGVQTDSGVHGRRGYEGDYLFMLLGASTPIPLRVWKVMGGLGHRMQFLDLDTKPKGAKELGEIMKRGGYKAREVVCKRVTHEMLRTLWNKHPGGIDFPYEKHDAEAIEWINKMAEFTASFRGEIIVYTEKEGGTYSIQHTRPMIEQATRLNQLFFNLACGHAVLRGGAGIEKEDVGVVARVMLASAADPRPLILRTLIERGGAVNVEEVQGILRCSRTRAQREMEKFIALGMCVGDIEYEGEQRQTFGSYGIDGLPDLDGTVKGQKKKFIEIEEKFKWLVSEELKEIIR